MILLWLQAVRSYREPILPVFPNDWEKTLVRLAAMIGRGKLDAV